MRMKCARTSGLGWQLIERSTAEKSGCRNISIRTSLSVYCFASPDNTMHTNSNTRHLPPFWASRDASTENSDRRGRPANGPIRASSSASGGAGRPSSARTSVSMAPSERVRLPAPPFPSVPFWRCLWRRSDTRERGIGGRAVALPGPIASSPAWDIAAPPPASGAAPAEGPPASFCLATSSGARDARLVGENSVSLTRIASPIMWSDHSRRFSSKGESLEDESASLETSPARRGPALLNNCSTHRMIWRLLPSFPSLVTRFNMSNDRSREKNDTIVVSGHSAGCSAGIRNREGVEK
mmetsp:Transcript_16296/g.45974  ORF Transcript_16296/g.45974 Transcript_16296/m.45974 type:complete len:296 (+) Transcript_16296:427-1314(+)